MTYWRDELKPASFRGVPFHVETTTTDQGLHTDEQVFPGRSSAGDAVHVEPLGSGPRRFQVEAFVVGEDYHERRDALEAALLDPSSARLVHPTRGEIVVSVTGRFQTTEHRKRGGYARVTFTVVETESSRLRRTPNTAAIVERDLDAFLDDLARDFGEQYDEDVPAAFQESAQDTFGDAVAELEGVYSSVLSGIGEVSDFTSDVEAFATDVDAFVSAPFDAAVGLVAAMGRLTSAPERLLGSVRSVEQRGGVLATTLLATMRPLIRFGEDLAEIAEITPNRASERQLREAVVQLVRGAAIGHTVRAVATLPFDSRTQASAARAELVDAFDRLVDEGSAGGDTVSGSLLYEAIARARTAMIAHLSAVARSLPELDTYTVDVPLPLLVIAHELYGDARREAEIADRNALATPYWLPIGTALEVLRG